MTLSHNPFVPPLTCENDCQTTNPVLWVLCFIQEQSISISVFILLIPTSQAWLFLIDLWRIWRWKPHMEGIIKAIRFFWNCMCSPLLTSKASVAAPHTFKRAEVMPGTFMTRSDMWSPTMASCGQWRSIDSGSPGNPQSDLWWHPRPGPQTGWWMRRKGPAAVRKMERN